MDKRIQLQGCPTLTQVQKVAPASVGWHYCVDCPSGMCLLLPCLGGSAWAGVKAKRSITKAFSSNGNQSGDQGESVVVTEARLALKLASIKPSRGEPKKILPEPSKKPTFSRSVSKKEADSKARLQELIDKHAPK